MNSTRRLCQALLNGPLSAVALRDAETLMDALLEESTREDSEINPLSKLSWYTKPENTAHCGIPDSVLLTAMAPPQLLEGIWLARVALPATGHQPANGVLLKLYTELIGLDGQTTSSPSRYRAKLTQAGISLPPLSSPEFFQSRVFPEEAIRFAALHLTLFHRPIRYFPELVGYTLAHFCREPDFQSHTDEETKNRLRWRSLAIEAMNLSIASGVSAVRIETGWTCYIQSAERLNRSILNGSSGLPVSHEERLAAIIKSKLPQAIGYHQRVKIEGQCLDTLLTEHQDAPEQMLRVLHDSQFIDECCPEGSRFVKAMEFGGPMFGVFNEQERLASLDWIVAPARSVSSDLTWQDDERKEELSTRQTTQAATAKNIQKSRLSKRELYLALLRVESPCETPAEAEDFINQVLRRARVLCHMTPRRVSYSPEALRAYVQERHRSEVDRYTPLKGEPKANRALCQWVIQQLAPSILVDGAWLAGIATTAEKLTESDRHLLNIYMDELGCGKSEWNHPNVFRRLLESQGLQLPEFDSDAFATDKRFMDAAFDVPVMLLAMGLLSDRFRPELLGLNLAIELSGLGATYMRAIDILRYHRMDPTIIELHLSIDNAASGHAVRACDAITLYLENIRQVSGEAMVASTWDRIWIGYKALDASSIGLITGILGRYAMQQFRSILHWRKIMR